MRPSVAVNGHGTFFFFGGTCGAKPESCWCDIEQQRLGSGRPHIIAGHQPGSSTRGETPAQRLSLAGCDSIGLLRGGDVDVLAFDRGLGQYGGRAIVRVNPSRGTYREWHGCLACNSNRVVGPLRNVSLYNADTAFFDPSGIAYLTNSYRHVIQRLSPRGRVSTITRMTCRSTRTSELQPAGGACMECADAKLAQDDGNVSQCPEWPVAGRKGTVFFVDGDDATVRAVDLHGHERVVAGGGTCLIWRMTRCGSRVKAIRLRLKDRVGDGPFGLALDGAGNLYITVISYIIEVRPSGAVHIVAGTGYPLSTTPRGRPYPPHMPAIRDRIEANFLTVDRHGHLFFLDDTGAIREIVR